MNDRREQDDEHQALLELQIRFHMLMEVAPEGMLVSQNGVVIEASSALLVTFGYALEEVIGRPLTDFVSAEFRDLLRQREAAGVDGTLEAHAVLEDGRRLPIEAVTRNYVIRGRTLCITALRDISVKRRLEEQVRQAQQREALALLTGGVAHDFKNILTVILGYGDTLVRELDEPHRGDAEQIVKAAKAGAALTRQLLAYSRQQPPDPAPIDLNLVVQGCEQMLRRLVGAHIALVTDLAPDAGQVHADAGQLQQVLFNLGVNARDAMPRGGTLVIRTQNADVTEAQARDHVPARPGRYVMLSVSDSGTGMSDEVRAHIFDPFFTTKESGRGTGLGLALVQEIVKQSDGFIVVDSTLGAGSTFAIYLPMVTIP
jgi:PAS domain S-box-containing protein